jgi:hypothetical protein
MRSELPPEPGSARREAHNQERQRERRKNRRLRQHKKKQSRWEGGSVASPLVVYELVEIVFRGGRGARAVGERDTRAADAGDS